MSQRYPRLFSRAKIGPVELPNRIVMAPMGTGLGAGDGNYSWQQIEYYASRARGGAGLILVEATMVEMEIDPAPFLIKISLNDGEDKLPRLTDMAEIIHYAGGYRSSCLWGWGDRQISPMRMSTGVSFSSPCFANPEVTCQEPTVEQPRPVRLRRSSRTGGAAGLNLLRCMAHWLPDRSVPHAGLEQKK